MSHALLGTGDGDNLIGGDLHIKTFLIIIFYRLMKFREIPESVMILFRILAASIRALRIWSNTGKSGVPTDRL